MEIDTHKIAETVRQYRDAWRENIDRFDAEASHREGWDGSDSYVAGFDAVMDAVIPLIVENDKLRTAITRESRDGLYSGEELNAVNALGDLVCDYIERCRTKLQLDGAIRAGVDHHIREKVLPMLSQRPKLIAASLKTAE